MENCFQMSTISFPLLLLPFLVCHWPQLLRKDKGNLNYLKFSIWDSVSVWWAWGNPVCTTRNYREANSERAGRTSAELEVGLSPVCGRARPAQCQQSSSSAPGPAWGVDGALAARPGLEPWAGDHCWSLSCTQFCQTQRVLCLCLRGWLLTLVSGCSDWSSCNFFLN